jgi:hypothetical protein
VRPLKQAAVRLRLPLPVALVVPSGMTALPAVFFIEGKIASSFHILIRVVALLAMTR